jgi:hypothetical protein
LQKRAFEMFNLALLHLISLLQSEDGSEGRVTPSGGGNVEGARTSIAKSGIDIVLLPEPVTQSEVEERLVQCCCDALAGCTDIATEQVFRHPVACVCVCV